MSTTESESRAVVSASVTRAEADRLRELARAADRSVSAQLRRALREHLEQQERPA
jgi:predicted transcriptional regulator